VPDKYKTLQRMCNTTDGIIKTISYRGILLLLKMRKELSDIAEKSGETYKLESFVIDGKFLLLENGCLNKITYPAPTRTLTTRFVMTTKEFMESCGEETCLSEPYM